MAVISLFGAILPTLFLVWMIWWADRYEREPAKLLALAFVWGALPAILLALLVELVLTLPFDTAALWGQFASTAIVAPFVEETTKGLALLGLLWLMRPELDDVLDGIVYGALVGAGFAMTENFLYFFDQESLESLQWLIFLRSGIFGMNHIFYTAVFGASVGAAAQMKGHIDRIFVMALGFSGAILLHMVHNTGAVLSQVAPWIIFGSTLMLWGGLFAFLILIILLLARERRIIRSYLGREDAKGLTESERKRLMSTLPPLERLVPGFLLPTPARRRARVYQTVAELAFRWHRFSRAQGAQAEALGQEIAQLQKDLSALTEHDPDAVSV